MLMRVTILSIVLSVAQALRLPSQDVTFVEGQPDLTRRQGRYVRSSLAGQNHWEIAKNINLHIANQGMSQKSCASFSHDELEGVLKTMWVHFIDDESGLHNPKDHKSALRRSPSLDTHLEKWNIDRRRDSSNMLHSARCAEVLMLWAHHVSKDGKDALKRRGLTLPELVPFNPNKFVDASARFHKELSIPLEISTRKIMRVSPTGGIMHSTLELQNVTLSDQAEQSSQSGQYTSEELMLKSRISHSCQDGHSAHMNAETQHATMHYNHITNAFFFGSANAFKAENNTKGFLISEVWFSEDDHAEIACQKSCGSKLFNQRCCYLQNGNKAQLLAEERLAKNVFTKERSDTKCYNVNKSKLEYEAPPFAFPRFWTEAGAGYKVESYKGAYYTGLVRKYELTLNHNNTEVPHVLLVTDDSEKPKPVLRYIDHGKRGHTKAGPSLGGEIHGKFAEYDLPTHTSDIYKEEVDPSFLQLDNDCFEALPFELN